MNTAQIIRLRSSHAPELLNAIVQSRELHAPWVEPPDSLEALQEYLNAPEDRYIRFGIRASDGSLGAVINLNAIVRGAFHSAFLGFYALAPHQRTGLVRLGLKMVIEESFSRLELHRLEANIQPDNQRSAALVKSLGFRLEGHSPRHLKIQGSWRDHDRYALTVEDYE